MLNKVTKLSFLNCHENMRDFCSLIVLVFIGCMHVDLVYPFNFGPFCSPSFSEEIRLKKLVVRYRRV